MPGPGQNAASGVTPKSWRPLLTNASTFHVSPRTAVRTSSRSIPIRPSWVAPRGRITMTSNIEYSAVPAMKPVTFTSEAAWDGDISGSLAGEGQDQRRELTRRLLDSPAANIHGREAPYLPITIGRHIKFT